MISAADALRVAREEIQHKYTMIQLDGDLVVQAGDLGHNLGISHAALVLIRMERELRAKEAEDGKKPD